MFQETKCAMSVTLIGVAVSSAHILLVTNELCSKHIFNWSGRNGEAWMSHLTSVGKHLEVQVTAQVRLQSKNCVLAALSGDS